MQFTKHHGLGNDFLVLVDMEDKFPIDAALTRAVCNRHLGVGADGLIRVTAGTNGADLTMPASEQRWQPGRDERQRNEMPGPSRRDRRRGIG